MAKPKEIKIPVDEIKMLDEEGKPEKVVELEDRISELERGAELISTHRHKGIETQPINLLDSSWGVGNHRDGGKVRAYLGTGQTVGASAEIMEIDTESFDTRGEFDTTTYRFTAIKDGYYYVYAQIYYQSVIDDQTIQVYIYKNGASIATGRTALGGTSGAKNIVVNVTDLVKLNKDDYIEIWGNSPSLGAGAGTTSTYMTILRIL